MSSIFGVFNRLKNSVNSEQLNRIHNKLSYWKPDRSDIWHDNHIGLGQLMLCITPESLEEKLPYKEGNLVITANARIDNRKELIALLELKNTASTIGDSLIILKAYQKWKQDCAKYLIGEFTFAIWDENEQTLFCAKDAFGTRPLYYFNSPENFVFSSEIKGILESGLVKKEYNDTMLGVYLIGYKGETRQTTFKNIFILPGAHWLMISANDFKIERYWDIDIKKEIKLKDNREYEEAFTELLIQSVKRRSRTAFPIGHLLSGGLDSTAISGIQIKEKLHTSPLFLYSWAHEENTPKEYPDDREYINEFLQFHKGGDFHHLFQSGYKSYFKLIPDLQTNYDEPFRDLEHYTRFNSYEQAQQDGVRLLMGGIGGDELVSSHADEYIISLLFKLRGGKALTELYNIRKIRKRSIKGILKNYVLDHLIDLSKGRESWGKGHSFCSRHHFEQKKNTHYLTQEFVEKSDLKNFIENHPSTSKLPNRFANPLKQRLFLNITSGSLEQSFNQRYNTSLAYRMLYTYPFLDRDLVSFLMSLPNDQFHQNGYGRSIIRRSMKEYVPETILKRQSKFSTSPNFFSNIQKEGEWLLSMFENWKKHPHIPEIIDLNKLEADLKILAEGNTNHLSADFLRTILIAFYMI